MQNIDSTDETDYHRQKKSVLIYLIRVIRVLKKADEILQFINAEHR